MVDVGARQRPEKLGIDSENRTRVSPAIRVHAPLTSHMIEK